MPHEPAIQGFLRLASILGPHGPIPVSRSTWWTGVKSGRYPKPIKLGPRITAWRVEDIRALIAHGAENDPPSCEPRRSGPIGPPPTVARRSRLSDCTSSSTSSRNGGGSR